MQRQTNTGVGAVGLWTGRHVYFDNDGKYPNNSIEGLMERNDYLERRNALLEELAYRACLEETEEENHAFVLIKDTTWG